MDFSQKISRRSLWIGIAIAVIVLVTVIGIVVALTHQQSTDQVTERVNSDSQPVATKSDIEQNLSDLDESVKQAAKDQAAAKAALKSSETQTKIGDK